MHSPRNKLLGFLLYALLEIRLIVVSQVALFVLTWDNIVFVKSEDVPQLELDGMSDDGTNGLSYIYTTWYAYQELRTIRSIIKRYGTTARYSRASSSTVSSTAVVRSLE